MEKNSLPASGGYRDLIEIALIEILDERKNTIKNQRILRLLNIDTVKITPHIVYASKFFINSIISVLESTPIFLRIRDRVDLIAETVLL